MAVLLLTFLLAAGAAGESAVLATFDGGVVTAADLALEETFLTQDERTFRKVRGFSEQTNRKHWIERVALRRIARRLAEREGLLAEPAKAELARGVARDFLLGRWRQTCYGFGLELPSEQTLAAEIAPTLVPLPPRLKLSHLFRRASTPEEVAAATAELAAWRREIKTLDDFHRLARELSHSSSAVKGGNLGWVRQGWLQPQAEAVLYGLAAGTLSEPLALPGGVHLFWVEDKRPAEPPPLQRIVEKRQRELTAAAQAACQARRLAEAAARADLGLTAETAETERLYRLALALDVPSADEKQRLADLEDNVWLDQVVSRRVDGLLGAPTEAELRARLEASPQSFERPRHLAIRRLSVPLPPGREPLAFYDALAALVEQADARPEAWSELVAWAGAGATGEAIPLAPVIDVAAFLGPAIFDRIHRLPKGAVAGPFQAPAGLVVVRIDDEQAAAPLRFAEAREALVAAWTRERRRALRGVVATELLSQAHFEILASERPAAEP